MIETLDIAEAQRRARSGPAILLGRRIFSIVVTLAMTFTVARILPPAAYGLANMAGVILIFGQMFSDFGLTNAVLRKGDVSDTEMSTLFWLNAGLTIVVAGIIAACSPLIAAFYHEPVVAPVILVSLAGFVVGGLALQHRALINRNLRFATLALIEMASLTAGALTTLGLALLYRNVWAIVFGTLVQSVTAALLFILCSGWSPGRFRRTGDLRSLLGFGANTSAFAISVFLSNNVAVLLVGHFLGAPALGQYNRAQTLYALPNMSLVQPITQAAMPLLARLRGDPAGYRTAYLGLVRRLCAFLMPGSVVLAIAAPPLVRVLLGPNWGEAGLVLAALAPSLAAMGIAYAVGDLLVTQDRAAELRTIGLCEVVLRVGSVAAAVPFGLVPTAIGFTLSTLVAGVVRVMIAGRIGPVTRRDQLAAALPGVPLALGSGAAAAAAFVAAGALALSDAASATIILGAGGVGMLAAGAAVPPARSVLIELGETFGLRRLLRLVRRR